MSSSPTGRPWTRLLAGSNPGNPGPRRQRRHLRPVAAAPRVRPGLLQHREPGAAPPHHRPGAGDCTCAAATSRRCGSGRTRSRCGAIGSAGRPAGPEPVRRGRDRHALGRPRGRRPRAHPGDAPPAAGSLRRRARGDPAVRNTYGADLRTRSQFSEALDPGPQHAAEVRAGLRRRSRPHPERQEQHRPSTTASSAGSARPWRPTSGPSQDRAPDPGRQRPVHAAPPPTRWPVTCAASAFTRNRWTSRARSIEGFEAAGGRENLDLAATRARGSPPRCARPAIHWDALQESEEVVQRYRDYLGPDHTYTLRAATNLINDRRAVGDLTRAEELAPERSRTGAGNPASRRPQLRHHGEPGLRAARGRTGADAALRLDLQARKGLIEDLRRPAPVHAGGEHQLRLRPRRVRRLGPRRSSSARRPWTSAGTRWARTIRTR